MRLHNDGKRGASSDVGTSRPSVLAVCMLTMSSHFVGRMTIGRLLALENAASIARMAERVCKARSIADQPAEFV